MNSGFGLGPTAGSIGYIMKMFPRLSETFILNEVLELERQGAQLQLFSLRLPADTVTHNHSRKVQAPVVYLPEKPLRAPFRILQGQLHVWRQHRKAWRHGLRNGVRRARYRGDSSDLVSFCHACCISREMTGVRHVHAHYANLPAKVALLVHRLTGVSYSISTHAKDIFQHDPFASAKLRERMLRARFIVANSRFSAEHIRRGLNNEGEVHVVYNGLDLELFRPRSAEPEQPLILGVGRLVEKKGFSDLLAACAILRQKGMKFSCEIVGTGVLSNRLKEEIRQTGLGDRVKLVGPLAQDVLWERYASASVFALPCVQAADGDRDILPNALKEAMAVGVPVITTRLEGIEELVSDGESGLLVGAGQPEALAAGLERLLKEPQLRLRLSAAARQVIEQRFDRRHNFANLKLLLEAAERGSAFPQAAEPHTLEPNHASCVR